MQTTDIVIDFTTGLSGSVAWPWPIAVYLFLAGISGGAVALAIIINLYKSELLMRFGLKSQFIF